MPKIIKIGNEYFVEFFGNGLKFQKKAGNSIAQAQRKLKEIEHSLIETAPSLNVELIEINYFFKEYIKVHSNKFPSKTINYLQSVIAEFQNFNKLKFSSIKLLRQVTPKIFEQYKSYLIHKKLKPHSINFNLYFIREVFEYAIVLGWLNDNPAFHLELVKEKYRNPKFYSKDEIKDLFSILEKNQRDYYQIILKTGISYKKLNVLRLKDYDQKNNSLIIDKETKIPLEFDIKQILESRIRNKESVNNRIFPRMKLNKIINLLRLRNTFIKNMLLKGTSLLNVFRLYKQMSLLRIFVFRGYLLNENKVL